MISTPAAVPYGDWGRLESAWRLTSGHGVCAHFRVRLCLLVVIALLVGAEVFAQNDPPSSPSREENRSPAPAQDDVQQPSHRWDWTGDLSAAFGFNYQRRKFTDFQEWE
jgi:hypothetical protein